MTSVYPQTTTINLLFFRNAANFYGDAGLSYATSGSAGVDLRACPVSDEDMIILPGERLSVPSGIAVEPVHPNMAGFVYSRSGLGALKGITVAQGVGVIDPDYRGEIFVVLLNTSQKTYAVMPGERIAQLIFQPVLRAKFQTVEFLEATSRGAGGFGHTGNG